MSLDVRTELGFRSELLLESVEYERHPWMIVVQWHPEMDPDDPHHQRIFKGLVDAARKKKPPR